MKSNCKRERKVPDSIAFVPLSGAVLLEFDVVYIPFRGVRVLASSMVHLGAISGFFSRRFCCNCDDHSPEGHGQDQSGFHGVRPLSLIHVRASVCVCTVYRFLLLSLSRAAASSPLSDDESRYAKGNLVVRISMRV